MTALMRRTVTIAATLLAAATASAQEASTEDLAKAAQNPVADMISLPFQSNTNFRVGPYHGTQEVVNIQPVIPFHISDDWNLITRTIIPVIGQQRLSPVVSSAIGLGDINPTFFLSPRNVGSFIWGVGPTFTVPSATETVLGSRKLSAGPAGVALMINGPWVVGALANQQWSVAGDWNRRRVSQMLVQTFVNYNMPGGWYLTSSPIITANWAAQGRQWVVPVGGGFGRVFKFEGQAFNASLQAFYNAIRTNDAPAWQVRAQLTLLFPK